MNPSPQINDGISRLVTKAKQVFLQQTGDRVLSHDVAGMFKTVEAALRNSEELATQISTPEELVELINKRIEDVDSVDRTEHGGTVMVGKKGASLRVEGDLGHLRVKQNRKKH